jgi:hypothetical protein
LILLLHYYYHYINITALHIIIIINITLYWPLQAIIEIDNTREIAARSRQQPRLHAHASRASTKFPLLKQNSILLKRHRHTRQRLYIPLRSHFSSYHRSSLAAVNIATLPPPPPIESAVYMRPLASHARHRLALLLGILAISYELDPRIDVSISGRRPAPYRWDSGLTQTVITHWPPSSFQITHFHHSTSPLLISCYHRGASFSYD